MRILLDLFNDLFESQIFPDQWNTYLVMFIPKSNSDNVRPISLASCILKIMERLIKERVEWWCERNGVLSKTQFGFRKGYSCMKNLSAKVTDIHKSFYKKNEMSAVFLDIKGAYDNVLPEVLISDMIELCLPKKIISFVKNLALQRTVLFCTNDNIEKTLNKGLPQGSSMSPLLYALYTRKMDTAISDAVKLSQFADDTSAYIENSDLPIDTQIKTLEREIANLISFLIDRGLDVAPEKCVFMIFDKSGKNVNKNFSLKIGNKSIRPG